MTTAGIQPVCPQTHRPSPVTGTHHFSDCYGLDRITVSHSAFGVLPDTYAASQSRLCVDFDLWCPSLILTAVAARTGRSRSSTPGGPCLELLDASPPSCWPETVSPSRSQSGSRLVPRSSTRTVSQKCPGGFRTQCDVCTGLMLRHVAFHIDHVCPAGLNYLGNSSLVHAQSIIATLAVQVITYPSDPLNLVLSGPAPSDLATATCALCFHWASTKVLVNQSGIVWASFAFHAVADTCVQCWLTIKLACFYCM